MQRDSKFREGPDSFQQLHTKRWVPADQRLDPMCVSSLEILHAAYASIDELPDGHDADAINLFHL
jgi:hypothetical protein